MNTVLNMDCLLGLQLTPSNYADAIVTDPPYELGFMGKAWDATGIAYSVEMWREALRVLKPGGHLLAFSGSRTYHRMACAIEDAGFEVRDQIMWVYGSGFPKSLDVSKALDKAAGAEREVLSEGKAVKRMIPGADQNATGSWIKDNGREYVPTQTAPATDAARQWDGWGTALKPAHEPICLARKPLIGTVAANVLAHGTGALNVDGCRVPTGDKLAGGHATAGQQMGGGWERPWMHDPTAVAANAERARHATLKAEALGRWPANIIHDGSDEVVALFPDSNGSGPARVLQRNAKADSTGWGMNSTAADRAALADAGSGSAARFFYCPKASKADRGEGNTHPTVKPTALIQYLMRLVTPPGGLVLDLFNGSGTGAVAAKREGFRYLGFEISAEYCEITQRRINVDALVSID